MSAFPPALHAGTPFVTVAGLTGPARTLAFLRHPDDLGASAGVPPARLITSRSAFSAAARTIRLYGARALREEAGGTLPDATTVSDLSGQRLMLHTADGDATLMLSDAAGRPLWARSAQGTVTEYGYEPPEDGGRPLSVTETPAGCGPRVRALTVWRKSSGDAERASNLTGLPQVTYDNAGASAVLSASLTGGPLEAEQRLLPADAAPPDWGPDAPDAEAPLIMTNAYDAAGALLLQTNAAAVTTLNAYDVSGAVRGTRLRYTLKPGAPAEEVVTLRDILYRADGVMLSQTAGNGITEEYEYDPRTQYLTQHSVRRPASHPAGALLLSDLHYGYDPAGNILTLEDKGTDPVWHNNQQAMGLRTYGYDTLYRLASATGRERVMRAQRRGPLPREHIDPSAGSAWSPYEETYQYDDGDNLIKQTHTGVSGWTRTTAVSSRSNRGVAQDSVQAPAADPHGAYLAGGLRKALDDGRLLAWYADGQLSRVTPVSREADEQDDAESYRYADPGTRVRKVRVTKVAGGTQTAVTTYAGGCETRSRVLGSRVQLYIRVTEAGGLRVIHDVLKGEVHLRYGFADHLGSVSEETDGIGNVTSREVYYPYGGSAGSDEEAEETTDRTRRYSGKERDATGLLYYGWRYYQAESGRWQSADPGGLIDGGNLFRFCRNNPVNIIDSDGRGCAGSKATVARDEARDEMLARRAGHDPLHSDAVVNNQASLSASPSDSSAIPGDEGWASWEEVLQGNNESIKLVHTLKTDHTDSVLLQNSFNQVIPNWKMVSTSLVDLKTWNGDTITYGEIAFVLKTSPGNLIKTAAEDIVFNNHQDSEFKRLTGMGLDENHASNKNSGGLKKFRQDMGIWSTKQLLEATARNRSEQMIGFGSEKKYNEVIITGREGYDIHKNGILSTSVTASEIVVLPDPEESVNWDSSEVPQLKGRLKTYVNKVANVNPDLKIDIRWPVRPVIKVPEFRF